MQHNEVNVAAKKVLTNALLELPGTHDWVRHRDVAERLINRLEEAGAVITFPDGLPEVTERTIGDERLRRLVKMDRRM
jgi:hypothetical protein